MVRGLQRGSVLLQAPAGAGKTVAIELALGSMDVPTAWVRCTGADRDPGRFLQHFVSALTSAAPGTVDALQERLTAGSQPIDLALATTELIAELDLLLIEPIVIVVDDAEHLDGAPSAAGLLSRLLAAETPALHLAVATRRRLPLKVAKLRAAGRLVELAAADLAFTVEDCAELIAAKGGEQRRELVEGLWSATEGWPLGIALALLSPRPSTVFGAGSEALARYLDEELLDVLDPELRAALLDSSVAPELDPTIAEALGLPDDFLSSVRQLGLPEHAGSRPDRVAYHPLLREHLASRLETEGSQRHRAELHRALADVLERRGNGPEAVEHRLVADDPAGAAVAVAEQGRILVRTAPATVAGWLDRLPPEARTAPPIRLLEGRLASGAGRFEEAIAPLREAVTGLAGLGEEEAEWQARFLLAETLTLLERFEEAIPLADGFESGPVVTATGVAMSAAASLAATGRYPEASRLFAQVIETVGPAAPIVHGMEGFWVHLECGRMDVALDALDGSVSFLERIDPFGHLPYSIGMAALIHDERGEPQRALETIARAREVAQQTVVGGYIADVEHRLAASVHARSGRVQEAEQELSRVEGAAHGWYAGDAEITTATIAAHRGDHEGGRRAVALAVERGGLVHWRTRWRNTALLVPVLVDLGQAGWARGLVDEALEVRPPLASCARLLSLRGWLRHLDGDESGAVEDVVLAWAEAGPEARHLLRRERPRLGPLLWTAVDRGAVDPGEAVSVLESADPRGAELVKWTHHPQAEARRAAVLAASATGHPDASARIDELQGDPDQGVASAARATRRRMNENPPPLVLTVLGGFAVRRGTFPIEAESWGRRRRAAQRLLRFMLVNRDRRVLEDELFEAFWPDSTPGAARRSLQVTASSVRAAIDVSGVSGSILDVSDRTYRLALNPNDTVDADEFERAALAAVASGPGENDAAVEAAVGLWSGEPLPEDRYADWATTFRERLIDLYVRVLGALADSRSHTGNWAGAVDASTRQVGLDPLDEAARRRLMVAYARTGRRGHALREYLACRRELVEALGVEPSEETTALQRRILAGEAV